MFIDPSLNLTTTANVSLGSARLASWRFSSPPPADTPRPVEILATMSVLALSLLLLAGAVVEVVRS